MTTNTPNWRQFAREACWSPAISNAMRLLIAGDQVLEALKPIPAHDHLTPHP
jgi:hypothetical protein